MNILKIKPSVWGPSAWHVIHNISINSKITDKTKQDYLDFIQLFRHIIPCPNCKDNLKEKYRMIPMTSSNISNTNMVHWMHTIHNYVNIDTDKELCDYKKHIELHKTTNTKKYRKFINILLDIMGDNPSFEEFIKIHQFIHLLYKVYPRRTPTQYNKCFGGYDDISSPKELRNWFTSNDVY